MEVILKAEIGGLGKALDVVNVKNGYAHNYLFPRGLAILATTANKDLLEKDRQRAVEIYLKEKKDASSIAEQLRNVSVTIAAKVHEGEKLYGSIQTTDIANKLKERGFDIDRKMIVLDEPIKQLGMFTVKVRLHNEVDAKTKVWVINDESQGG